MAYPNSPNGRAHTLLAYLNSTPDLSEWRSWDPQTLRDELRAHSLGDEATEQALALAQVRAGGLFTQDPNAFYPIILLINGRSPSFDRVVFPHPEEITYALRITGEPETPAFEYSDEVAGFVRTCCSHDGLSIYPKELEFADEDGRWSSTLSYMTKSEKYTAERMQAVKLGAIEDYVSAMLSRKREDVTA